MTSKIDIINNRDLCNILTPELVEDLVNSVWCREDQGYIERSEAEELQSKVEKIVLMTYIKKYH